MFPGDTCQSGRRAKAWAWPQLLSRRGISHALHSPGSIRVKQETSGASDPSLASHQPHSKAAAESCHCIWEEADLQALRQISEEASPQPGRPLLPQATAAPAPDPPSSALSAGQFAPRCSNRPNSRTGNSCNLWTQRRLSDSTGEQPEPGRRRRGPTPGRGSSRGSGFRGQPCPGPARWLEPRCT